MKSLLIFSCIATLAVTLNACNTNSVDPNANTSARLGGPSSGTATGPHSGTETHPHSGTADEPHSLTDVAVANLPVAITTYISTNYAGATIKDAKKDPQGYYLVAVTIGTTVKVLVFKADGTFVKELSVPDKPAKGDSAHHPKPEVGDTTHHSKPLGLTSVAVSSLPATITTYISTNYAGSTIEKADKETSSGDYIVLIETKDSKRVLLLFGSDGTFKKALSGK